ncbi:Flp family type IVb pilin [Nocardioides sp. URHA0032]|uniref:Flp family type IVb pilin n=1 Tax=Nocardioides sp. URHA0032 TaxID=1380388 RepID=UPI00048CAEA7|nr:Flp family type IVb pilin [Nocardioides sp. URHA0032]
MLQYIRNLMNGHRERDERGASAVEYGLLVGGIAAVIVVLVFALGSQIKDKFSDTCDAVKTGGGAAASCTTTTPGGS